MSKWNWLFLFIGIFLVLLVLFPELILSRISAILLFVTYKISEFRIWLGIDPEPCVFPVRIRDMFQWLWPL